MNRIVCVLLIICIFCAPSGVASEQFRVEATAAVLIDGGSGRVLYNQNMHEMLPMASTTKIMTALLALEHCSLDETVTAGKNAAGVSGTSIYLTEGETLSMEDMLYGLMLRSGNDAAVAIAEHVAGSVSAFADMMNERAKELNADAHYVNPHGLDADGHAASALGLARIMRACMQNEDFRAITGTKKKIIPWEGNEYNRTLVNKNKLLSTYEGATGGKTGYTSKAGRCLVFSAERDGMELIGVVLHCPTWFDTATTILDYGFENYQKKIALTSGQYAVDALVTNGTKKAVSAIAQSELSAAIGQNEQYSVEYDTYLLEAPVQKGQRVGTARLLIAGEVIADCPLIAAEAVPENSLVSALQRMFRRWTCTVSYGVR